MSETIEKFEVRNRWTNAVQFTAEISVTPDMSYSIKLGLAVQWGIKARADLTGANLTGAYLTDANLTGANLTRTYLTGADLTGADLARADLTDANLTRTYLTDANLTDADLTGADLARADLTRANLTDANLTDANLTGADLTGADLARADLTDANLTRTYLTDANLTGAKGADLAIAKTRILPEGALIGWKKCRDGVIVKMTIPEDAARSHAFGRKCRAQFVDVLEVIGANVGIAQHDGVTEYRTGERVTAPNWSDNWQEECAGGIHFFITRTEAEAY